MLCFLKLISVFELVPDGRQVQRLIHVKIILVHFIIQILSKLVKDQEILY
jgi:hypothetical protein